MLNEVPHHEDVWGIGCVIPPIINLGTSLRWVVSFTVRLPLPIGKEAEWASEPV